MARKAAHLEMVGGKPPRQHMWEAVRANRDGFTRYQIARKSNQDDGAVKQYLTALHKGGFIAPVREFERAEEVVWQLLNDIGVEAPNLNRKGLPTKEGLATEAIWRTLRILGEVSAEEVATYAATSGCSIAPGTVDRYCADLLRAGYLARHSGRYQLLPRRYTGPKPPIVQRRVDRQVYDPNLDKVVWTPPADEVQPEPAELTWLRIENERLRTLLGEWLGIDDWSDELLASANLVERTRQAVQP